MSRLALVRSLLENSRSVDVLATDAQLLAAAAATHQRNEEYPIDRSLRKFNPYHVPAGLPGAGEFTTGGDGNEGSRETPVQSPRARAPSPDDSDTPQTRTDQDRVRSPAEVRDIIIPQLEKYDAVAFVGGFFDGTTGIVQNQAHEFADTHPGKTIEYFSWLDEGDLRLWIQRQTAAGKTPAVIGHSWGGDTAAKVVAKGTKVDLLLTLDPVSSIPGKADPAPTRRPDFKDVAANGGKWINVVPDYHEGMSERSNFIAGVGGRWNKGPQPYTTEFYTVYETQ
ncbi:MAG: hypothetical protein P4M00_04350 [Azospirillaceae bacterium]|nr:hypothetical protein [Azospirillaceae bacterium]